MNPPILNQITLIGVGLIGGSFVLDLKRLGLVRHVTGIDVNKSNLERALERKVIDSAAVGIRAEHIAAADLVLIATPVSTLGNICRTIAPFYSPTPSSATSAAPNNPHWPPSPNTCRNTCRNAWPPTRLPVPTAAARWRRNSASIKTKN